jgi:uncharacterized protein with von Willebrand factor type A (vWA) domain
LCHDWQYTFVLQTLLRRPIHTGAQQEMDIDDQVKKLQESQLFADRRTEELHEAVLDLSRNLKSLSSRLATMEGKLETLINTLNDDADTCMPDSTDSREE